MTTQEKNKIKCKEYYYKTKDNLSLEVLEKRRQQAKIRARKFYYLNKDLCKIRVSLNRYNNQKQKNKLEERMDKLNSLISEKEIKFIKSNNISILIKKSPRLKMWEKQIKLWTHKDFNKLLSLI